MSDASAAFSGFALRTNGSCLANEVDCGATRAPFRACCPGTTTKCPEQYNVNCCPTAANCTASLLKDPQCANRRWDLYDNDGYFCCRPGFVGYKTRSNSDGCAKAGDSFQNGETLLKIMSKGGGVLIPFIRSRPEGEGDQTDSQVDQVVPSSTSTSTTSSPTSSHTTSSPSSISSSSPPCDGTTSCEPETPSKSNTGAIAGGVVGGVAGLAIIIAIVWIILRRKRPVAVKDEKRVVYEQTGAVEKDASDQRSELPSHHGVSELE
ncbi:uncharacterized protein BP5553_00933 [Venustampulla echinocandica]|uniref:Mid2 domain-containing protein n=1 Tax=Venustampulla echinocandica TaxID=2656787 RepID=A0A370TZK7_9HELO|nr:uncharacterized protein BP5553_00933 [Venustampulla echinocandica]RDL40954.1 hypothetical protein BP5553_00933 [Venustampulla echinocandica]